MVSQSNVSRSWCACTFTTVLTLVSAHNAFARQQSPWTGVIGNEAAQLSGSTSLPLNGLSADGRFLAFTELRPLPDGSVASDVWVRDRHTGLLQRIDIATTGIKGDGLNTALGISANGRHVVFESTTALDPADSNNVADIYVRDLDHGTTSLISAGPNGESAIQSFGLSSAVSGDGRFVAFAADFGISPGRAAWLRDRDADGNGVFDEPGGMSTTLVSVTQLANDGILKVKSVTISSDARFVAYTASTVDQTNTSIGFRLFLHDRQLGTTVRVDRPLPVAGDSYANSELPGFSDRGQLVYMSNAPYLVSSDADTLADVFVYTIATGAHERLFLNHRNDAAFVQPSGAAISADARFVVFTGDELGLQGQLLESVYAIDREAATSYDISLRRDGTRDERSAGQSISADGSAIAFSGGLSIIHGGAANGVYVATQVELFSPETSVPRDGGSVPIAVDVPADTAWTMKLVYDVEESEAGWTERATYTGAGPSVVNVNFSGNTTGGDIHFHLWLGSEEVLLTQVGGPFVTTVSPDSGPATGGTPFRVFGSGFKPGATVTLDGAPATDIVFVDENTLSAVTPHNVNLSLRALVSVTNPDQSPSTGAVYFFYNDETPPVITSSITGTLGADGWYTSDVSVRWTVEEGESEVSINCEDLTQTTDVNSRIVTCSASSAGGDAFARVEIKRDATPPTVSIAQPQAAEYRQGELVAISFSCADATSAVTSCTANQSGNLDTSTPGTFTFTATAIDAAGNQKTSSISYTVRTLSTLDASAALGAYGGVSTLTASLMSAPGALVNRTVSFFVNNAFVGTAVTTVNGDASLLLSLAGRNAGTLPWRAEYAGDATTTAAVSNTATLTIAPATLHITAVNAAKVYGQALPAFSAFGEGFVNGDDMGDLSGTLSFSTPATATSDPGMYPITPGGVTSGNYVITFINGSLTIARASTALSLSSNPNPSRPNQNVEISAAISVVAPGGGAPDGTVEFRDNGSVIGSAPVVNGVAAISIKLKKGSHSLTATYAGSARFNGSSGSIVHQTN